MISNKASISTAIKQAADAIRSADALLISAGAGMGVDSGLPDFRGAEGFWNAYPPYRDSQIRFEQLANPKTLTRNAHLFWGFYGHRLNLYRRIIPHAGFGILRRWAEAKPGGHFVFTSNVDGSFQRGGFADENVVECHGSIHHFQCAADCDEMWSADGALLSVDEKSMLAGDPLPHCPKCEGYARPSILMFNDAGWNPQRTTAQERRYETWIEKVSANSKRRLAVVECGAGTAIPTVRMEGQRRARWFGGTLIRINPRDTAVPDGEISIPLEALDALRQLDELI